MSFFCIHASLNLFITLTAMIILDIYLIRQNSGTRKTGVLVLLIVEEFCHIIALKFVISCLKSRLRSINRGFSTVGWFLFVVIYDIKMYFVLQHQWKACLTSSALATTTLQNLIGDKNSLQNSIGNRQPQTNSLSLSETMNGITCEYSYTLISKKVLTLSQSVLIPSLFLLLVGELFIVDEISIGTLAQIKLRAFWTAIDILDLLQLQSITWEEVTVNSSYELAICGFFYSYILLVVIPALSLVEMSKNSSEDFSPGVSTLVAARLVLVNIGTSLIRLIFIFLQNNSYTSSIFIGKNFICFYIQVCNSIRKNSLPEASISDINRREQRANGTSDLLAKTSSENCSTISKQSFTGPKHPKESYSNIINRLDLQGVESSGEKLNSKFKENEVDYLPSATTGNFSESSSKVTHLPFFFHKNDHSILAEKVSEKSFRDTTHSDKLSEDSNVYGSSMYDKLTQRHDSGLLYTSSLSSAATTYSNEKNTKYGNDVKISLSQTCMLLPPPSDYAENRPGVKPAAIKTTEHVEKNDVDNLVMPLNSANMFIASSTSSSYSNWRAAPPHEMSEEIALPVQDTCSLSDIPHKVADDVTAMAVVKASKSGPSFL